MSNSNEPRDLLDELETLQRVLDDAASDQVDQAKAVPVIEPAQDIPVLSDALGDKAAMQSEPPLLKPEAPVLKAVAKPAFNPNQPSSNEAIFPLEEEATSFDPNAIADLIDSALDNNSDVYVDLFDEPQGNPAANDIDIPTLADNDVFALDDRQPAGAETEQPVERSSDQSAQQSSEPPLMSTAAPQIKSTVASNNPFLPQAVLERLAREREAAQFSAEQAQATMAKIMGTPAEEPPQPIKPAATPAASSVPLTELHKTAIIDQLVHEMMPEIEARLRQILADKL
ncbi:hypothetical protein [Bacterioplanoides sp.]|uniref:hypothetical protein n=1 Tax=Bacterioplanoides sp. TaxID=2066072 RepID=UPI003B5C4F45